LVLLTSGSGSSPDSSDLGHLDGPTFTSGVNSNSSSRLKSRSRSKRVRYGRLITSRRIKHLLLRTLGITCLMLSSGTRSLGILNCVLVVWPILVRVFTHRLRGFFVSSPLHTGCSMKHDNRMEVKLTNLIPLNMIMIIQTTLRLALWAGTECLLVGSPFAAFQYYAYRAFCMDSNSNTNTDTQGTQVYSPGKQRRPWCDHRLPLAYNFVQGHYWSVQSSLPPPAEMEAYFFPC
jgi:hypothetical protein